MLRWPVETREKGEEASLRRRGHDLLDGTLAAPGQQKSVYVGGRFEVPLASQSGGWAGGSSKEAGLRSRDSTHGTDGSDLRLGGRRRAEIARRR